MCLTQILILQHRLRTEGFDTEEMLENAIKKLENDLKKARKKEGDANDDVPVSFVPIHFIYVLPNTMSSKKSQPTLY